MNRIYKLITILVLIIPTSVLSTPMGQSSPFFATEILGQFNPLGSTSVIKIFSKPIGNDSDKAWIAETIYKDDAVNFNQLDFAKVTADIEFYDSAEIIEPQKAMDDLINISPNPIIIKGVNILGNKECGSTYPLSACDTTQFFNITVKSEGVYKLTIKFENFFFKALAEQLSGEDISGKDFSVEGTFMIIAQDGIYGIFSFQNGLEENMRQFNLNKSTNYQSF